MVISTEWDTRKISMLGRRRILLTFKQKRSEVYPIVKTIFGATYVWSEGLTVTCSLPSPS
jgi:hypothetical protein